MSSFENVFGYLYRSYTKSMLKELSDSGRFNDPELITVAVFQFNPYDMSFYYAPTIKNIFIRPSDVNDIRFPTSSHKLWNHQLMLVLANYIGNANTYDYVERIFQANEKLEKNGASIFAITNSNYQKYRESWLEWYKENQKHLKEIRTTDEPREKILLNQLFYFSIFLLSIMKRAAFTSLNTKDLSNAESIYRCITNNYHTHHIREEENRGFITRGDKCGELHGFEITWSAEPQTGELGSQLKYILEVCFRQPFDVKSKIDLIQKSISQLDGGQLQLNAIGIPLYHNGEFLGISYAAWASNNSSLLDSDRSSLISAVKTVLRNSRISVFLYKARLSTARFSLRNISFSSLRKSQVQRIFENAHLFSSSILSFLITENQVLAQIRYKDGNNIAYRRIELNEHKPDDVKHTLLAYANSDLKRALNEEISEEQIHWVDLNKTIYEKNDDHSLRKIFKELDYFEVIIKGLISDEDFTLNDFIKYTSATIHTFTEEKSTLVFFNSNFKNLFDKNLKDGTLVKQSFARELHKNIVELIEVEKTNRSLFIERQVWQDEIEKGLLHSVKSTIDAKINMVFNKNTSDKEKLDLIKKNGRVLVDRLNDYLKAYNNGLEENETDLHSIINVWSKLSKEFDQNESLKILEPSIDLTNTEVKGNIKSIKMIFEEYFSNALKASKIFTKQISLKLKTRVSNELVSFTLVNEGSVIEENHRRKLGVDQISDSRSSGLGFLIIEVLLDQMEAVRTGKNHFSIKHLDDQFAFEVNFELIKI